MSVERFRMYRTAACTADNIREEVLLWNALDQQSLGGQLVRSADSVAHNIAEMDGRTTTSEKLQFLSYAEGSLQEARSAIERAKDRNLMTIESANTHRRNLTGVSLQMLAFASRLLDADPNYTGAFKAFVERRRHLLKNYSSPNPKV